MILYFSSTGNSRFAAEKMAEATNDRISPITETAEITLSEGERLGFVFPTYFWRLPSIVDECMQRITVNSPQKPYIYFIATYGSTCGQTGTFMKKHLRNNGLELSAAFGIKTVDDWTVWFDMNNAEEVSAALKSEKHQLETVTHCVIARQSGDFMKNKLPMIAVCGSKFFYDRARRTKHLRVEESCIGCGICAKECPTKAIEIRDGKPVWIKEQCTMCLHCLHSCPKFAIQYDNKTQNHGQYMHP